MLTGDQADVAVSICRRVGIPCCRVLTGAQLDEMTDSALSAAVEEVHVFAELTPGQKVRLVFMFSLPKDNEDMMKLYGSIVERLDDKDGIKRLLQKLNKDRSLIKKQRMKLKNLKEPLIL